MKVIHVYVKGKKPIPMKIAEDAFYAIYNMIKHMGQFVFFPKDRKDHLPWGTRKLTNRLELVKRNNEIYADYLTLRKQGMTKRAIKDFIAGKIYLSRAQVGRIIAQQRKKA